MTRKHFVAIAARIAKIEDKAAREKAAQAVATACAVDLNLNFNIGRFYAACNIL